MSSKVEVLDRIMGSYKTQAMIQWMKESSDSFIYVTPLLSEVEARVGEEDGLDIYFPTICKVHTTKGQSLLALLKGGGNIATTHSMYSQLTSEHLAHIRDSGYIVICDEMIESIAPIDHVDCLNLMESGNITIDDLTGQVLWTGTVLDKYRSFKHKCDRGLVFASKAKTGSYVITTQLPLTLITAARRFILCTYRFEGSVLERFFTLKGIPNVPFTDIPEDRFRKVDKKHISSLVKIIGSATQLKKVRKHKLTTTWWRSAGVDEVNDVGKLITALGKQHAVSPQLLCWCVPKENVVKVRPDRGRSYANILVQSRYKSGANSDDFEWIDEDDDMGAIEPRKIRRKFSEQEMANKRCYLPCNSIATNLYANRKYMLHFQNRYAHMTVKNYLHASGVPIDDDHFALSEFLQWLWRSCIRNDETVYVCIGSKRMQDLFEAWLEED